MDPCAQTLFFALLQTPVFDTLDGFKGTVLARHQWRGQAFGAT